MQICEHVQGLYLLEVGLKGYANPDGKCIVCPRGMNTNSCCDDLEDLKIAIILIVHVIVITYSA